MEAESNITHNFQKLLTNTFNSSHECLIKVETFLQDYATYINTTDKEGENILHKLLYNTERCRLSLVKLLIQYGADANSCVKNNEQLTPLMIVFNKHELYRYNEADEIIMYLIEIGAIVITEDSSGRTTLCHALYSAASIQSLRLLLDNGCVPDSCKRHISSLHCFSKGTLDYNSGIIDILLEKDSNVLRFGNEGESAICLALKGGAGLCDIQRLMHLGAKLNECKKHSSIWICATQNEGSPLRAKVFELFKKEGFSANSVNENGYSAIQLALYHGKYDLKAVELLAELPDVDFSVKDKKNRNLLHLVAQNCKNPLNQKTVVKLLINKGVLINSQDIKRRSPLYTAIEWQDLTTSKILINNGALVNTKDTKEGRF